MLQSIRESLPTLSRAEQRVARWVLDHPRAAAGNTLAIVAAECGTSEPTVIRFCRRVGLSSFRELAIRLTEAMSNPASYAHSNVTPDDSTSDAVTKVLDASIGALVEMRSQLSSLPFDATIDRLMNARQLAFAGIGASGHVARDATHKFFRLGIPCCSLTDSATILQFAATTEPGDTLILLSLSGRWPEFVRAARRARDNGAGIIALTDPTSQLAKEADLLLPCRNVEDTNLYTPMSSRLAQLALLDAIQVGLALRMGERASEKLRRSKSILLDETA